MSGLANQGAAQGRAPDAIPGQYIVVLKDEGADSSAVAEQMSQAHGLRVGRVFSTALNGFAAFVPPGRLEAIVADPRVAYVEPNRIMRLDPVARGGGGGGGGGKPAKQTVPWGITRIGAPLSTTQAGNGSGSVDIDIAILDTGIDSAHPDLLVVGGQNFTSADPLAYLDGHGHGTHVAGTSAARDNNSGVVGVAPGARLWSVRVLDSSGSGTYEGVIAGIEWVANHSQIRVANMSLSGGGDALNDAIEGAVALGKVFVVAAGNNRTDASLFTPGSAPSAITVSALNQNNTFASYSNHGSLIDLIAPGTSVLSTARGGGTTAMSGTSMASPHVAGAAALFLSRNAGATSAQVRDALVGAAEAGNWPGDPDGVGEPLVKVNTF